MKGQGICLRERALIIFPDGQTRSAQIWQHTGGVRGIYAIAPDEEGMERTFALSPVWAVNVDEHGQPIWQGMGAKNRLREIWEGLKLVWSRGQTRISRLNLA